MRLLLDDLTGATSQGTPLSDDELAGLYDVPTHAGTWLRANFVASLDGAATGADGRSGSINTDADFVVFSLLRALSHAVIVGAGTLRAEGYGRLKTPARFAGVRAARGLPDDLALVIVSRSGQVPPTVAAAQGGRALMLTCESAPGLADARRLLGAENTVVVGDAEVDLDAGLHALHARGWTHLLTEGGPSLHTDLHARGLVDELDLTLAPIIVGAEARRITHGQALDAGFAPTVLVEEDGSLMGRWLRRAVA